MGKSTLKLKFTRIHSLLLILVVFTCIAAHALPKPVLGIRDLTCEHRDNPLGLAIQNPRLSWKLVSNERNTIQTAYEIIVDTSQALLNRTSGDHWWSSAKRESAQSVLVTYTGPQMRTNSLYFWKCRVWDNHHRGSSWSDVHFWQMGMLSPAEWTASWISFHPADTQNKACPMFRKTFSLNKSIQKAFLYVSAHGLYEAYLNGEKVGNAYLTPGWTSYTKRLQYQVYDVTASLHTGANALGIMLGNGWYSGQIGFQGKKSIYGKDPGVIAELKLTYSDGTGSRVVSDQSWLASTGPVLSSDIYDGEVYDARLEKKDWSRSDYNSRGWSPVKTFTGEKTLLVSTDCEPVVKHETFTVQKFMHTPKGELVADFGQNLVGWVEVKITGHRGQVIKLSHAEVLDKAQNFYITNLRSAKQQTVYILKGGGEETFHPHFTFEGFRFIKIEGITGNPVSSNFKAVALYTDMKQTGTFTCSDKRLNQLQHNISWGQKGNFLDVPTDCPQRDERLGWTGDAQVFSNTAAFNRNVSSFFTKWLKDLGADQRKDGAVPFVIPNILDSAAAGSAGWSDAATIIPWNLYEAYGDTRLLEEQYSSMKSWVEFMHAHSNHQLWNVGFHFGDWLFYRPDDDNDGRAAITDKYLIAQAFYAHSTQLLISAARVLGKPTDELHYSILLDSIKRAFVNEYMTPSGRLVSGSQTAYVLALKFDLLPSAQRQQAVDRLVGNIISYGYHISTGFLGTPYLCAVLTRFGRQDVAFKLIMQDTYPSWLYPLKMGATTIWERWDGIKPDSTFQTPSMNSFNHYAYGAIGEWMYRSIAGLTPGGDSAGAGYRSFEINPHIGGGLDSAQASLETPYGKAVSGWKLVNGSLILHAEIPPGASASLLLPQAAGKEVREGSGVLSSAQTQGAIQTRGSDTQFRLGSGTYTFSYPFLPPALK